MSRRIYVIFRDLFSGNCEPDSSVNTLIIHLPDRLQVYWLDIDLLHEAVKGGGFPGIKKKDIIYPLQSLVQSHPPTKDFYSFLLVYFELGLVTSLKISCRYASSRIF
jgi:hypothetical protein